MLIVVRTYRKGCIFQGEKINCMEICTDDAHQLGDKRQENWNKKFFVPQITVSM